MIALISFIVEESKLITPFTKDHLRDLDSSTFALDISCLEEYHARILRKGSHKMGIAEEEPSLLWRRLSRF
jgi:hypothetical protein